MGFPPQIRQDGVLILKRYVWGMQKSDGDPYANLQVVALICVHLAMKHWQRHGIPEQKLHWLSRNSYTRQHFIAAEMNVMLMLGCCVYWEGVLLAEWVSLLLFLAGPLLADPHDTAVINAVAAHITDVLAFQDELMTTYWPSELAAATLHTAVLLCTRRFQRCAFTLRVAHFCRMDEEQLLHVSEKVLKVSIGSKFADIILEGSALAAEDSDFEVEDSARTSIPVNKSTHNSELTTIPQMKFSIDRKRGNVGSRLSGGTCSGHPINLFHPQSSKKA